MRDELVDNLRQLLELDRGLGIEFQGKGGLQTAGAKERENERTIAGAPPPRAPAVAVEPSLPRSLAPSLPAIATAITSCRACGLCQGRIQAVVGTGAETSELAFVSEGPDADEDASGQPVAGKSGELFDKMLAAMGLSRNQVFICNVVRCRPPGNRLPTAAETAACLGHLTGQLQQIRPKLICTLGNTPLRVLMADETLGVTRLRGTRLAWRGIPLIPTFHPAYLLRNPESKKSAWEDLKQVLAVLGRAVPKR
jgi:uracil-DNA glycosylase family 4